MSPERSRELFQLAIDKFQEKYKPNAVRGKSYSAKKGLCKVFSACVFGSYMNVSLVNDGPVTFLLDSKNPKVSCVSGYHTECYGRR